MFVMKNVGVRKKIVGHPRFCYVCLGESISQLFAYVCYNSLSFKRSAFSATMSWSMTS
jgi:hypothetical protein